MINSDLNVGMILFSLMDDSEATESSLGIVAKDASVSVCHW